MDINKTIANLPRLSTAELRLLNGAACRLINSAAYTAPHAGDGRVLANPVRADLLCGRGGA